MLVLNTLPSIPIVPLKNNTSEETIRNYIQKCTTKWSTVSVGS